MSKCGLCGKEFATGEQAFSTFGLMPPTVKVCACCLENLKPLYFSAPKMSENEYQVLRKSFKEKYNNPSAEAVLLETDQRRNSGSSSPSGQIIGGVYSNPGSSMITIAKTVFYIISVLSILAGIALGNITYEFNFILFLVTAVSGVLIAYLTGLALAAFGHLVYDVKYIRGILSSRH